MGTNGAEENQRYYNQRREKSSNVMGPGDFMEVVELFYSRGKHMF